MSRRLAVVNLTRGLPVADRTRVADGWWSRLRGLLGSGPLAAGEGLLLVPCRAVHMTGMRFSLDVAFLDRGGRVVALYPRLAPGARTHWHRQAHLALELPAGTLERTGTASGDTLAWRSPGEAP